MHDLCNPTLRRRLELERVTQARPPPPEPSVAYPLPNGTKTRGTPSIIANEPLTIAR
jgi:hypothetical protein